MCAAGQLVMGDATFNHIYNGTDSTGKVTQRLRPETAVQEDQDASGSLHDEARARSISPEAGAQDGLDALHNAIVSNTDGSMSLNAAGTPTGNAPSLATLLLHNTYAQTLTLPAALQIWHFQPCAYGQSVDHETQHPTPVMDKLICVHSLLSLGQS